MNVKLNFELNEAVLKQFGIDMDSQAHQELKAFLLEGLEDTLENLYDNNRYFGEEDPVHRRRLGLVKALIAD